MNIIDLTAQDEKNLRAAALILVEAFRDTAPGSWPDLESGRQEAAEAVEEGKIARCALDEKGEMLGWIGGLPAYEGNAWELHPLAVAPQHQGRGVGRALVLDLEEQVRRRGGLTIFLGTDDVTGATSLSGVDLYPNVWEHVSRIQNLARHPYQFYLKLGYVISGVVPDANGRGKPDILMAKRVGP